MLVTITRVINWSILFAFIACFSYQIVYLIAPYIKKEKTHKPLQMHRYAVLIAARNEENVLGGLLDSIRAQNYPSELVDIYVVADTCWTRFPSVIIWKITTDFLSLMQIICWIKIT